MEIILSSAEDVWLLHLFRAYISLTFPNLFWIDENFAKKPEAGFPGACLFFISNSLTFT